jgi:hypothetical protein
MYREVEEGKKGKEGKEGIINLFDFFDFAVKNVAMSNKQLGPQITQINTDYG